MSTIAPPDRIIKSYDSDKKCHISQDYFWGRAFFPFGAPGYKSISRFNADDKPVWGRAIFQAVWPGGANTAPKGAALSKDGQSLYVVGAYLHDDDLYSLIKLNAATGETIWTAEFTMYSHFIVVDHNDDIIIWGQVPPDTSTGYLMKFDSDGNNLWGPNEFAKVKTVTVDSQNNIYIGHSPLVSGYGIQMLTPNGIHIKGGVAPSGAGLIFDIVLNSQDEIFTVGSAYEGHEEGVRERLLKWEEGEGSLDVIDSAIIGISVNLTARNVLCDSKDNIIADGWGWLHSYTSNLNSNWSVYATDEITSLTIDVQNRIHVIGADYNAEFGGIVIFDKNGNEVEYTPPTGQGNTGGERTAVMAREVWIGEYTDQNEKLLREDVACFLDDELREWVESPDPEDPPYDDGDIIWYLSNIPNTYINGISGIYESLQDDNEHEPGTNDEGWLRLGDWDFRLGKVPPSGNEDWDSFPDVAGGVGGSPRFYTVTIVGMLVAPEPGDPIPSPYNGEYLLVRGPGAFGFFFGVQHDAKTRMNFTLTDKHAGGDELFQFGTADAPSSIFNYTDTATNTGQLTSIANSNEEDTPDAIAYGGTMSIYPVNRRRWDPITLWPADEIVAWKGRFYQANNPNQGSEPPSGNWTVL